MKFLPLIGRVLFALIFILSGLNHLLGAGADHAAATGVPAASFLVPFAGLLSLLGGLSIATGYKARAGAWLLVLFLVPVTFAMHPFWAQADPMMKQMHMAMFMKNIALLGTALLIARSGTGPYSLDARPANA
ncbi:MAG: DoxX family protein [Flavobacteriales bacterium]